MERAEEGGVGERWVGRYKFRQISLYSFTFSFAVINNLFVWVVDFGNTS